jgi:hypothetical protein
MLFVNRRLKIVKPPAGSAKEVVAFPPGPRLKVRDALVEHPDLIDAFVDENPFDLAPGEVEIVRSWKHLVAGEFYVLRHLKAYTVFLTAKTPTVAYGVVALNDPFEVVIQQPLPFLCKSVLLPCQGRIVYDGLLWGYNVLIGGNIRRELNESYNQAKKRYGVVTSLPWNPDMPKATSVKGTSGKRRAKRGTGLIGRWRITWMEAWDQDFVDEEVEGFFEFGKNGTGEFQFGSVRGIIDYREAERDGKPAVEFSWDGNAEMDPAQGRGWAVLDGDEIEGRIFFHQGDDSAFRAARKK